MGPFSHYVLAAKLEQHLNPHNPDDYYWGSIIPDIRYLAKIRRDQTHLDQECLQQLSRRYPHLESFLIGYQVHCLIDKIDVTRLVSATFPLNVISRVLRKNFSQQQITMMVEMYYLQSTAAFNPLVGSHNEVLSGLGITPEQSYTFYEAMNLYFSARSLNAAITAYQKIGMVENDRLEKYSKAAQAMKNKKFIQAVFMQSIKNARIEQNVLHYVESRLKP